MVVRNGARGRCTARQRPRADAGSARRRPGYDDWIVRLHCQALAAKDAGPGVYGGRRPWRVTPPDAEGQGERLGARDDKHGDGSECDAVGT